MYGPVLKLFFNDWCSVLKLKSSPTLFEPLYVILHNPFAHYSHHAHGQNFSIPQTLLSLPVQPNRQRLDSVTPPQHPFLHLSRAIKSESHDHLYTVQARAHVK